jgi:hypothetical protein
VCHYCGCRQMPLIRDYVAEHERATELGADAVRAGTPLSASDLTRRFEGWATPGLVDGRRQTAVAGWSVNS